jgi:Spy/CpxP family protein refolding chaperone
MKRVLILITLLTAMAVSAAAQPGPPPPPHRDALPDYLQLTDAQKTQWQAAHAEFEAAMKAAHDALEAKLAATLTPEQKVKFDAFKAARGFLQQQRPPHPEGGPGHAPR